MSRNTQFRMQSVENIQISLESVYGITVPQINYSRSISEKPDIVDPDDLGDLAYIDQVGTLQIVDEAIETAKIALGAVTEDVLADEAVTASKVTTGELITLSTQIKDATIIDAKIADLSATKITAGTITSQAVLLGTTVDEGDVYIAAGNNLDLNNWVGGDVNGGAVILGIDQSDSDKGKFFVGNNYNHKFFKFDGDEAVSSGVKYVENYVAGENVDDGDVVCIKPTYADYIPSDDAYVFQNAGDTNYGSEETLKIGQDASGFVYISFMKWNMSTIPTAENILKAELIVYERVYSGGAATVSVQRVTSADWSEGTITFNNKPSETDDIGTQFGMQDEYAANANGQKVIDITQLVRQWKDGAINNYGIYLYGSNGSPSSYDLDSTETTQGVEYRPRLRIYTTDESEAGVFKANCSDYLLSRCVVGVVQGAKSLGEDTSVQYAGKVDNLNLGSASGGRAYLNNTDGDVATSTNNLNRVIKLGKIIGSDLCLLDIQDENILIEKLYTAVSSSGTKRFYAPKDARFARVYFKNTNDQNQILSVDVYRDSDALDDLYFGAYITLSGTYWRFTWGANYIDITNLLEITNIYFFT